MFPLWPRSLPPRTVPKSKKNRNSEYLDFFPLLPPVVWETLEWQWVSTAYEPIFVALTIPSGQNRHFLSFWPPQITKCVHSNEKCACATQKSEISLWVCVRLSKMTKLQQKRTKMLIWTRSLKGFWNPQNALYVFPGWELDFVILRYGTWGVIQGDREGSYMI